MFYFYILQSEKDGSYYHGSTQNLKSRLIEHRTGKVLSTKYKLPVELVYYEAYRTLKAARLREQQVKASGSNRANIHKRIA